MAVFVRATAGALRDAQADLLKLVIPIINVKEIMMLINGISRFGRSACASRRAPAMVRTKTAINFLVHKLLIKIMYHDFLPTPRRGSHVR